MNKELVLGYIDTAKALCVKTNQKHAFGIFEILDMTIKKIDHLDEEMVYLVLNLVKEIVVQTEANYNLKLASNQPKSEIVNNIHYNLMELDGNFDRKLDLDEVGGAIGMVIQKHIIEHGGDIEDFIKGLKAGIEITNDLRNRK